MRELIISENESGQRLDKFLKKYMRASSGAFIYKMLRKKNIVLNGRRAAGGEILAAGDSVKLFLSDETIAKFGGTERHADPEASGRPNPVKRAVIYEDEDLIFINKPAGMLSQRGSGKERSAAEYLADYLISSAGSGSEEFRAFRPSPANRLDRNTSGLLLCGKSLRGLQFLSDVLKNRTLRKEYLVIVNGSFPGPYRGEAWYVKDHKKNKVTVSNIYVPGSVRIETAFRVCAVSKKASLLEADLITGRSHQIRAHLALLGYRVVGDPKYGSQVENRRLRDEADVHRQLLHAEKVIFPDSMDGRFGYLAGKSFSAPVPDDFRRAAKVLGLMSGLIEAEKR